MAKKLLLIGLICWFQQMLWAQDTLVGSVQFYKSFPHENSRLASFPDKVLSGFSHRVHQIELTSNGKVTLVKTDSLGVFSIPFTAENYISIRVNPDNDLYSGTFQFEKSELQDTLLLGISDAKLLAKLESDLDPTFYKRYNEQQALRDFENEKRIIIIGDGFDSEAGLKKRQALVEKYGVEFVGLGCETSQVQNRISCRYNAVMYQLLGIEEKEMLW